VMLLTALRRPQLLTAAWLIAGQSCLFRCTDQSVLPVAHINHVDFGFEHYPDLYVTAVYVPFASLLIRLLITSAAAGRPSSLI